MTSNVGLELTGDSNTTFPESDSRPRLPRPPRARYRIWPYQAISQSWWSLQIAKFHPKLTDPLRRGEEKKFTGRSDNQD